MMLMLIGLVVTMLAYAIGFPTGLGWQVEFHDVGVMLVGAGIYKAFWE